jgi:hypothetical protein
MHDDGSNYQRHKKPWEQGLKERFKSNFSKQEIQQNYVIQKQEHEMCKTNMKMDIYYANICKYEHKKNMIRLWVQDCA